MRFAMLALVPIAAMTSIAEAAPTMVFQFEAQALPAEHAHVPDHFSTAITRELGGARASFSIADAAANAQCAGEIEDPDVSCLARMADSHGANRMLFGTVSPIDGGLKVTLTRFVDREKQRRSFTVRGDILAMTDTLVEGTRVWLEDLRVDARRAEDEKDAAADEVIDATERPDDVSVRASKDARRGTTYVFLVGGGISTAVGLGFLYSSMTIADEVRTFRPRTENDFNRLVALENKGSQRHLIGTILTAAGGVTLAYGLVRAIQERRTDEPRLDAMPIEGGAALVYSRPLR